MYLFESFLNFVSDFVAYEIKIRNRVRAPTNTGTLSKDVMMTKSLKERGLSCPESVINQNVCRADPHLHIKW